jgi:hypothetical protein
VILKVVYIGWDISNHLQIVLCKNHQPKLEADACPVQLEYLVFYFDFLLDIF